MLGTPLVKTEDGREEGKREEKEKGGKEGEREERREEEKKREERERRGEQSCPPFCLSEPRGFISGSSKLCMHPITPGAEWRAALLATL